MQPVLLASSAEKRDDQVFGTGGLASKFSLALAPTTTGHRGEAMADPALAWNEEGSRYSVTGAQGALGLAY
jgi:hypothetical protein